MKQLLGISLGILTATGGFIDAGAIATSGAAGANFGLGLIWAMVLATGAVMLMVEMSGRLTAVSGKTYADGIRERFGFRFYLVPLSSEVLANSLLLAADLGGMAIAMSLFTGIGWHILLPVAALILVTMVWRAPFSLIENGPSLAGLITLLFWVAVIKGPALPQDVVATLARPSFEPARTAEYLFLAAAILGAIISPYLLYFYSSGAGEEQWSRRSLSLNRITAVLGMAFGSTTAIALIIVSAMVLEPKGIAGLTLSEVGLGIAEPLGRIGGAIFATALFVTCLGAALEITLSMGYNICQGFGWEWGEDEVPAKAPRFNVLMLIFPIIALVLGILGPDPLSLALYGSAFTALVLPISLVPFLVLMNDPSYLGDRTNGRLSNIGLGFVLLIAFVVAVVSIPLLVLSGG